MAVPDLIDSMLDSAAYWDYWDAFIASNPSPDKYAFSDAFNALLKNILEGEYPNHRLALKLHLS